MTRPLLRRQPPAPSIPSPAPLLLRGGELIDGTGARPRRADVRLRGGRITEIGRDLRPEPGETVLDCGGRAVCPGFLDAHSHADGGLLDSDRSLLAETQIRQGITTAVVGQDGGSNGPTLAEWLRRVERAGPALNVASFVGHGTARGAVLGDDYRRPATAAEILRLRAYVAEAMRAGALGLSTGLEYEPGRYATTEEVIALATVAGVYGGLYISHIRDEEDEVFPSLAEALRIGREARLPAQVSHLKLGASGVWGAAGRALRLLADARRAGQDVSADVYPYTYWQSGITVLLGDADAVRRAPAEEARRAWADALASVGGAKNIRVTGYAPDPSLHGKTVAEIAAARKTDPAETVRALVEAADGRVGVIVTAMREDDLEAFLRDPFVMLCTDGGLRPSHPRGAGSYPRVLGRYVRERRVLSLEEAIRKATSLPAKRFGFVDRGVVRPGAVADLVVFDPRTVADRATTDTPAAPPVGLGDVLVGGVSVLEGGEPTGARPGRVLRRGRLGRLA